MKPRAGSIEDALMAAAAHPSSASGAIAKAAAHPRGGPGPFVAEAAYEAHHPSALAVYCSDGRFTQAVEELLGSLGHARLDTLTIPGGAALLNAWTASVLDADHVQRAARFLITGHGIREVVLVAHAGCGYYRARHPNEKDLKAYQITDLRAAAGELRRTRSGLEVKAFYAMPRDGRVTFEAIDTSK
ncbi:MAG: carbonic anhydrase [Polyangiaceae bacterium]